MAEQKDFRVKNGLYVAQNATIAGTLTIGSESFDSAVIRLITENAIDSSTALQLLLDSSEVVQLIDSDYVSARVPAADAAGTAVAMAIALG